MSPTVFMHVGVAKTGTTFLQRVLWQHRGALRRAGTIYPGPGKAAHFFGSLDLRGVGFLGHDYPQAAGMWDRLVAEVNAFDGNALISHETFAHCTPDLIEKVVAAFPGRQVRAVITCRDLGRQIPAVWQERLKNRNSQQYTAFVDMVLDAWHAGHADAAGFWVPGELRFWVPQDLVGLTQRWSGVLGTENMVVVTVPPADAGKDVLWTRFAEATSLPALDYAIGSGSANPSLGVVESELLRRLNTHLDPDLEAIDYLTRIKRDFAQRGLALSGGAERLVLPPDRYDDVAAIADSMVAYLAAAGHPVVGDLSDLRLEGRPVEWRNPAEVPDGEILGAALDVLAEMVTRKRAAPAASGETTPAPIAREGRSRLRRAAAAARSRAGAIRRHASRLHRRQARQPRHD